MVLYERDFYNEGAVVHIKTKNESWIRMHYLLKLLGIKNNKFFLALHHKELMDVDPFSPDLTHEQIALIGKECIENPWYYFREIIRIPQQGGQPTWFRLDRATLALLWTVFNDIDAFITVPRQICKTMTSLAIISYFFYIGGQNINISMLAKDRKLITENTSRLKSIRECYPPYLIRLSPTDTDNKEGLSYDIFKNKFTTYVARMDEYGADNLGRGMSTPIQVWDEFGYFRNNHISYPAAVSATNAAVDSARAAGMPAFNILATTAAMLDTEEGAYAYSVLSDAMRFSERLYDCDDRTRLLEIIDKNAVDRMLYITFSYLQLNKTHQWLKEKTTRARSSQDQIDTDYLNIWKHGMANSVLSPATLKIIKDSLKEPFIPDINLNYIVRWYVSREQYMDPDFMKKPFVIGMDCSENIGLDYTAFVMIDPADLSVVATCRCNESNLIDMGRYVVSLLLMFEKAVFIPERNHTGVTILDVVFDEFYRMGISPYKRIFNMAVQNKYSDQKMAAVNLANTRIPGDERRLFGFRTHGGMSTNTRDILYRQVLKKAVSLNANKIYDSCLIDELSHLEVRNGRIDHSCKGHDDMVISYLLACYFIFHANNIDYYGIDPSTILNDVKYAEAEETDSFKQQEQMNIRKQIQYFDELIARTSSKYVIELYERQVKSLKEQLDDSIIPVSTISQEHMRTQQEQLDTTSNKFDINKFKVLV